MSETEQISVEESDLAPEITIGEGEVLPKNKLMSARPNGLLDLIKSKIQQGQVKIVEELDESTSDVQQSDDLVKIIHDGSAIEEILLSDDEVVITEEQFEEISVSAQVDRLMTPVSAESNVVAAKDYSDLLRYIFPKLLIEQNKNARDINYRGNEDISREEIMAMADRWQIPVCFLNQGAHWVLVLNMPEKHDRGQRVLIYDPMKNGESFVEIQEWDETKNLDVRLGANGIYFNELAKKQIDEKKYNLSLAVDWEVAQHEELLAAKMARAQFDSWNCGPMSLFAAAIRTGIKKEPNSFKGSGRNQLHKDIGLYVYSREELLDQEEISIEE
jgi:hypothetical protein